MVENQPASVSWALKGRFSPAAKRTEPNRTIFPGNFEFVADGGYTEAKRFAAEIRLLSSDAKGVEGVAEEETMATYDPSLVRSFTYSLSSRFYSLLSVCF